MQGISVYVVGDQPLVTLGIKAALTSSDEFLVAGYTIDAEDAIQAIRTLDPQVLVIDWIVPQERMWGLLQAVRSNFPALRILVITCCSDQRFVRHAWQNGVQGFVMNTTDADGLLRAVRRLASGDVVLPLVMLAKIGSSMFRYRPTEVQEFHHMTPLSGREHEVIRYLCQGITNREIGLKMGISENTVRNHLRRIYAKCRVSTRSEAVQFAVRAKLVDHSDVTPENHEEMDPKLKA